MQYERSTIRHASYESIDRMIKTKANLGHRWTTTRRRKIGHNHELDNACQELKFHEWRSCTADARRDQMPDSKHVKITQDESSDARVEISGSKSRGVIWVEMSWSEVQLPELKWDSRISNTAISNARTATLRDPITTQKTQMRFPSSRIV